MRDTAEHEQARRDAPATGGEARTACVEIAEVRRRRAPRAATIATASRGHRRRDHHRQRRATHEYLA
jgi:hypothetical protein